MVGESPFPTFPAFQKSQSPLHKLAYGKYYLLCLHLLSIQLSKNVVTILTKPSNKDLNNHLAICLSDVNSFNAFNGTFRLAVMVNSKSD